MPWTMCRDAAQDWFVRGAGLGEEDFHARPCASDCDLDSCRDSCQRVRNSVLPTTCSLMYEAPIDRALAITSQAMEGIEPKYSARNLCSGRLNLLAYARNDR